MLTDGLTNKKREKRVNNGTVLFDVTRISNGERSNAKISYAKESPVTILLNGQELVTLLCYPIDLKYLAVGYLSSEGFIENRDEIESVLVDKKNGIVRIQTVVDKPVLQLDQYKRMITSGCGRGVSFYSEADISTQKVVSQKQVDSDNIFELVKEFQTSSQVYKETHGVHSAAICNEKSIIVFNEDIGRHNAIDKVIGKSVLEDIPINDLMVVTSGRISSEIVYKIAKRQVPILISTSAPTDLGVRIAEDLGITLISSVRGKRMNINTNNWRVK
jgi:FdhD protein